MIKLYGIPNCDTVKKAKNYLYLKGINDFEFINFKTSPPSPELIKKWKRAYDNNWPVNTRSRTYQKIKERFEAAGEELKIELIQQNTSVIKRPILEVHGKVVAFGFSESKYTTVIYVKESI